MFQKRRLVQTVVIILGVSLTLWMMLYLTNECRVAQEEEPKGFSWEETMIEIFSEYNLDVTVLLAMQYVDEMITNITGVGFDPTVVMKLMKGDGNINDVLKEASKFIGNENLTSDAIWQKAKVFIGFDKIFQEATQLSENYENILTNFLSEADIEVSDLIRNLLEMILTLDQDTGVSNPRVELLLKKFNQYFKKTSELPKTECLNTSASTHSQIIFLDTPGKDVIDLKYLSSVESAAIYNPDKTIQVTLVTESPYELTHSMKDLQTRYPNIKYHWISAMEVFKDTALSKWFSKQSKLETPKNALKVTYLWKNGGIYLDLDVLMLKSTRLSQNCVATDATALSDSVMAFGKHHPFLQFMMENKAEDSYLNGGAQIQQEYLKYRMEVGKYCDIALLPRDAVTALRDDDISVDTLAIRWNNTLAKQPGKEAVFHQLLKKYSPVVYAHMNMENMDVDVPGNEAPVLSGYPSP